MPDPRRAVRLVLTTLIVLVSWLSFDPSASGQILLAQTGTAKTILGWLLTIPALALGLLVVCRPSTRKDPDAKEKKPRK